MNPEQPWSRSPMPDEPATPGPGVSAGTEVAALGVGGGAWLDADLAARRGRDAAWPEPAAAREVLEELAFRMRGLRQRRRGSDPSVTGDAAHPAVAEGVLLRELAEAMAAVPACGAHRPERLLEIAGEAPALVVRGDDGNMAFASRGLQMALAGEGCLRASRRAGTPEAETLRALWRVFEWRPIAARVVAGHPQPSELTTAVLALAVAEGTPTDWTLVISLALDLAQRGRWPVGAHQALVHRIFDEIGARVAAGDIGGQVITDALGKVQTPGHAGEREFRAWLEARAEVPSAWRVSAGALFALAAVDAARPSELLLAKADRPHLASMLVQLSAEPLLAPAILRRLPPEALAEAAGRLPDPLVLPVAISCLAQGGPAGLARGLISRLAALYRGLVADVHAWEARVARAEEAAPRGLEIARKGKLVWTLPLQLQGRDAPPAEAVTPDPLIAPVVYRWRSTSRDALGVLLGHEAPSLQKAFFDALGADDPVPKWAPLDASPAFALTGAATYAAPFAGRLAANLRRDASFALGPGPAGAPAGRHPAEGDLVWASDAYFTLRAGAAMAAYITTAGMDPARFAAHLQARLTALALTQHRTVIERAIGALWAPAPDGPLACLAASLRGFAAALTGP